MKTIAGSIKVFTAEESVWKSKVGSWCRNE